jgi:hypothetical protein
MKTKNRIMMLFLLMVGGTALYAQQYQEEVPGDNFSLEGALELFKKSASPEEFERLLNSANAEVNNLDLNGDGDIDYIRVIDRNKGAVHTFILQAVISPNESQDIAVIALEKLANGKAVLQITGDADIYGIETIIEPTQEVRINAGTSTARSVVNVWSWPSVQYVYGPYYDPWISPWHWTYRPIWWNPWRPIAYIHYYPRWASYHPYYDICYTPRIRYAHEIYRPYRSTSVVVYNRHQTQITNYRSRSASGYTRGRDNDRQVRDYQRQNNGSRYDVDQRSNNSRSTANTRQSYESSRREVDRNGANTERSGSLNTREESTFRNRSTSEVNRPSVLDRNTREAQGDDSRNRSNSDSNIERQREFRSNSDTRTTERSTPQFERRESGNSGGQRSAPQMERRQSNENSGAEQRSAPQFERRQSSDNAGGQRSGGGSSGGSSPQKRGGN